MVSLGWMTQGEIYHLPVRTDALNGGLMLGGKYERMLHIEP
jgi:hypothetical protein